MPKGGSRGGCLEEEAQLQAPIVLQVGVLVQPLVHVLQGRAGHSQGQPSLRTRCGTATLKCLGIAIHSLICTDMFSAVT